MCAKSIDNVCAKACRNHTTKGAERASPMSARRSTVACLALAVLEQVTSCAATTTDGVTKVPPTTWVHCVGKVVTPLLWASWVSSDVAQLEKPSRHLSPHGYLHGLQPHHQPRRVRTAIRIKHPFSLHLWGFGEAFVKPSGNRSRKTNIPCRPPPPTRLDWSSVQNSQPADLSCASPPQHAEQSPCSEIAHYSTPHSQTPLPDASPSNNLRWPKSCAVRLSKTRW